MWRDSDGAHAFDSLSLPIPSWVYGPEEPPEPAVPRGAHALLGASPLGAPFRCGGSDDLPPDACARADRHPAEPYLGALASCHLLPATDHLSSLPRLLATVAAHYGDPAGGRAGITDDLLFRLVRLAFL